MTDLVSCSYCNGKGKRSMGGIESDCRRCDGKGANAPIVVIAPISAEPIIEPVIAREVEILEQATSGYVQIGEIKPMEGVIVTTSDAPIPNEDMFPDVVAPFVIHKEPEVNPQLQAALDETKMTKADWNTKYGALMAGIDPKMRNEMRTDYAKSKKLAPRKVNSMAAQEGVTDE